MRTRLRSRHPRAPSLDTLQGQVALYLLVTMAAAAYASVGHGGASAYLAILSLYRAPADQMATGALVLNVLVAGTALLTYARAGYLSGRLTWPFVVASVPAAYLGGYLRVPAPTYDLLLAAALLAAAVRLWWTPGPRTKRALHPGMALLAGAAVGLVSGMVGVGGGIFLSPLILLAAWGDARETAATSAAFIAANSLAGLAGRAARGALVAGGLAPLIVCAFAGGLIGARTGAYRLPPAHLRRLLAILLLIVAVRTLAAR